MGSDFWLQWRAPRVSLHQRWYPRKTFFGRHLRIAELIARTSLSWLFFSPLQIILLTWTTAKPFYKPQLFFLKTSPTLQTTPVPKGSLPWVSRALTYRPLLLKLICLFIGFKYKGEYPCSLNISAYRKTSLPLETGRMQVPGVLTLLHLFCKVACVLGAIFYVVHSFLCTCTLLWNRGAVY